MATKKAGFTQISTEPAAEESGTHGVSVLSGESEAPVQTAATAERATDPVKAAAATERQRRSRARRSISSSAHTQRLIGEIVNHSLATDSPIRVDHTEMSPEKTKPINVARMVGPDLLYQYLRQMTSQDVTLSVPHSSNPDKIISLNLTRGAQAAHGKYGNHPVFGFGPLGSSTKAAKMRQTAIDAGLAGAQNPESIAPTSRVRPREGLSYLPRESMIEATGKRGLVKATRALQAHLANPPALPSALQTLKTMHDHGKMTFSQARKKVWQMSKVASGAKMLTDTVTAHTEYSREADRLRGELNEAQILFNSKFVNVTHAAHGKKVLVTADPERTSRNLQGPVYRSTDLINWAGVSNSMAAHHITNAVMAEDLHERLKHMHLAEQSMLVTVGPHTAAGAEAHRSISTVPLYRAMEADISSGRVGGSALSDAISRGGGGESTRPEMHAIGDISIGGGTSPYHAPPSLEYSPWQLRQLRHRATMGRISAMQKAEVAPPGEYTEADRARLDLVERYRRSAAGAHVMQERVVAQRASNTQEIPYNGAIEATRQRAGRIFGPTVTPPDWLLDRDREAAQ